MKPSGNRSDDPFADLLGLGSSSTTLTPTPAVSSSSVNGIGLFDYAAQALNQVTIKKGEKIKIVKLGAAGGWSEGTNSSGHTGYYPTDYVQVQKEDPFGSQGILNPHPVSSLSVGVASAAPALQSLRAKVLFDYQAPGPQSMSLIKGQIIEVRTRGDRGGWSVGLHGAFPTDFVEFLPASTGANDPFMGLSADPMPATQTQVASNTHGVTASSTQSNPPHISQSSTAPTSTFIPPPPPKKNTNPAQTASVSTAVPASATPTNPKKESNHVPPPPARTSATTAATAPPLQSSQPADVTSSNPPSSANAVSKPPGSTAKAIEPQGFQKVERHRASLVAENKETTLNPLDGTSFVLTPGTLSSPNAVWRQYLYMDLFADCHVRQMADPRNHVRSSTATSRVVVAMNTIQKGLQYLDLVTYPTTVEVDLIRDVRETLLNTMKVSLDLCSRIPPRTSEPSKMFTFLATLMMRIAKMSIGDYLMFPVSWQNTTIFKSETELAEHAVLIILRRINRDTSSDFSVTIVNTSG